MIGTDLKVSIIHQSECINDRIVEGYLILCACVMYLLLIDLGWYTGRSKHHWAVSINSHEYSSHNDTDPASSHSGLYQRDEGATTSSWGSLQSGSMCQEWRRFFKTGKRFFIQCITITFSASCFQYLYDFSFNVFLFLLCKSSLRKSQCKLIVRMSSSALTITSGHGSTLWSRSWKWLSVEGSALHKK